MTPELKGPAIVGKFYLVPCVRLLVDRARQHPAAGRDGWIPVIGPEHEDREVINFKAMHFHIDARFAVEPALRRCSDPWRRLTPQQSLMGYPVSTYSDEVGGKPIPHERKLRRVLCRREATDFPTGAMVAWLPALEMKHAACKLKPGNICPHRGIDLTPFIKEDGTVICPGHGLRWDTRTGELMPHQAVA